MDPLASKVAERFARSKVRLGPSLKRSINTDLRKAGFDGNGRFIKIGHALTIAFRVLSKHGFEPDETLNAHLFREDKGFRALNVAMSNEDDPFSPESVTNSALAFSWTKLDTDRYEVIAYMS